MADNFNISYSYQSGNNPTPPPADTRLYAFADCTRVDLPNGGVLLLHKSSDKQMIVAPEVALALQSCKTFRTLPQHVAALTSSIPQLAGQQTDVSKVLEMVRDTGLLVTAESQCQRLSADQAAAADLAPTRVFIITCDRPGAVQRLLESMLHAGNLSRHQQLVLVDDSRNEDNAAQNRLAVEQFNVRSPRNMQYLGAAAQHTLMTALIASLPQHEQAIRFLIDRRRWAGQKSYGLARTLCLLLSVGNRAIVMDDDVICAAVDAPHKTPGLAFGNPPQAVEFYASQQDILARTSKAEFDPLTGHAQCLGMGIGQAIKQLGFEELSATTLQGANAAYLNLWQADSPVLMTQTGSLGDPGSKDTSWVMNIDENSTHRLLASAGGLEGALANRHYWTGQPRPTFSKLAVISQMTGLDNSHLLPPYFPVFRGEDYTFGAMLEYLHPQGAILDYDWCVPHFPMDERSGSLDIDVASGRGSINLRKYITDHTDYEPGLSVATRLNSLVLMLRELAESSDAGLVTLYRTEVAQGQGNIIRSYSQKLQDGIARPQVWRDYLEQSVALTSRAMQEVARLEDIPGIPTGYDAQTILTEFRLYATEFAASLEAWPEVRETARILVDQMLAAGDLAP